MTDNEFCPRCTLPRDKKGSGSLTQWMTTCSCDREGASTPVDVQSVSLNLCKHCGKRADQGRVGSLTQFIFRYDLCSCKTSNFLKEHQSPGRATSAPPVDESSNDGSQWSQNEDALAVDQDAFPRDRYKPLKLMGKGAEGTVYLCRDLLLNKLVAIKLLNVLTDAQLQTFQLEAKVLSKLDHPNIVRILDFGVTVKGAPYMVLEQTEGVSVEQWMEEHGPLSWRATAKLFLPLTKALGYCHTNGIFHRDLKPSNILILDRGSWLDGNQIDSATDLPDEPLVQLVDFGVAKHNVSDANDAVSNARGTMVGTPSYMAPDEARGFVYDERSEIYSLGCTMYAVLMGRPPFQGDSATEILLKHTYEPAPLIDSAIAEKKRTSRQGDDAVPAEATEQIRAAQMPPFPEELIQTVARCLEKEPGDRFQSMNELADALAAVVAIVPPPSVPDIFEEEPGSVEEIPKQPVKSRRNTITISIAAAIVCGAGTIAFVSQLAKVPTEEVPPPPSETIKSVPKTGIDTTETSIGLEDLMDPALQKVGSWSYDKQSLKIYDEAACKTVLDVLKTYPYTGLKINGWVVPKLPQELFTNWQKLCKISAITITESSDENLAKFAEAGMVDKIELYDSSLSGAGLAAFNDKQLKTIYFSHCENLENRELAVLKRFSSLRKLTAEHMNLDEERMRLFTSLPLLSLSLDDCKIPEDSYSLLADLPSNLESLNLRKTGFSDRHRKYLYGLTKLKKLTLAECPQLTLSGKADLQQRLPTTRFVFVAEPHKKKPR